MIQRLRFIIFHPLFFPGVFFVGFLYRLYLGSLAEPQLIWDMGEYSGMASDILRTGIGVNCCTHGAGYPLFLSLIYGIFGVENITAVRIVQALLDTSVSVFLFFAAYRLFGRFCGYIAYILYMVNPFTSAYTGLVLTESFSFFLVSIIIFLLSFSQFYKRLFLVFLFGVCVGFLAITKISLYFFTLSILLVVPLFLQTTLIKRAIIFLVLLAGFVVASSYSLFVNYSVYKKISVMPPYRTMGTLLYGSFFINYYPELTIEFDRLDPAYAKVTEEYYFEYVPNPQSHPDYEKKYMNKFWSEFSSQPFSFVGNTMRNMILIWDKRYLYTYNDPFYPEDTWVLRGGTLVLFIFFILGLAGYIQKNFKKRFFTPLVLFTVGLFVYISSVLAMVSNESRLSLVFYPVLILWASYGVYFLLRLGKNHGRD